MHPIRSERASLSVKSSPPFDVEAILRRFSTPSPYTGHMSTTDQSTAQHPAGPSQENDILPKTPFNTVHKYVLTSRGREYATIIVVSRAPNIQDTPLLHFGDDINGLIVLPRDNLSDMRSMEVVFQLFESDPISPSYETKRVLSSQQVDESCISGGQFIWPFLFKPPPVLSSPLGSTAASNSSTGHLLPQGHSTKPTVQLIVTIYRRGRLTRNVGLRQPIRYARVMTSSPTMMSTVLPSTSAETPSLPADSSWPHQNFPNLIVKGVMFRRQHVEVECKLFVPVSYPVSDVIPLRLEMTSEGRQELDLFSVSDAIDIRLLKAMTFGENAGNIHPFTLKNRSSYHRTEWAAKALWEIDADAWELAPSDQYPRPRWRIKLNGELHRDQKVPMGESFEQKGMALTYFVCFFPFRAKQFDPTADPKRELFMGKLPLTRQR